jgi:hypothetical protein
MPDIVTMAKVPLLAHVVSKPGYACVHNDPSAQTKYRHLLCVPSDHLSFPSS